MDADLANELFGLMVFPNFMMKSLEVVEVIHPPLHAEMDQLAWMCSASPDVQWGGQAGGLVFQPLHLPS